MSPDLKYSESMLSEVRKWALQWDPDPAHSRQVCFLCKCLFDELVFLRELEGNDCFLLQAAALAHDIGWSAGGKGHHKQSMKMILSDDLFPFQNQDRLIVANIARYHRKSLPKESHENFSKCSNEQQHTILILSSFLRLADGLDASHQSIVRDIKVRVEAEYVVLVCDVEDNHITHEKESFQKKKNLFEQTFERKLLLECKKTQ